MVKNQVTENKKICATIYRIYWVIRSFIIVYHVTKSFQHIIDGHPALSGTNTYDRSPIKHVSKHYYED